jgi:glutamine synthetase
MILPAVRYLNELLAAAENLASSRITAPRPPTRHPRLAGQRSIDESWLPSMRSSERGLGGDDVHSKARHMRANIIPAMTTVRAVCDRLEKAVPDDLWPLPRYREMLFVK